MYVASSDDDGQDVDGLRSSSFRQHDTKDGRDLKMAPEMRNKLHQDTKFAYELRTCLDTKDPVRAVLEIVSFGLCFN